MAIKPDERSNVEDLFATQLATHSSAAVDRLLAKNIALMDAEDAVETAAVRILRRWRMTGRPSRLTIGYITKAGMYAYFDEMRRERREATRHMRFRRQEPATPEENCTASELLQSLESAVRTLPPRTRHVFMLVHMNGLSINDASMVLHVTARAVEKQLQRGRRLVRAALERQGFM